MRLRAVVAAVLVGWFAVAGLAAAQAPAAVAIGQRIPDFSAPLSGGGSLSDKTILGKWTIVEFWGLWCEDSLADLDHSAALARAAGQDPELRFVTIHVDQRHGRWGSIEAFQAEEGVNYPVALDPHRQVARAFGVSATPTYLVVDPTGVIRGMRRDLRTDEASQGGVKRFIQDIAALRRAPSP